MRKDEYIMAISYASNRYGDKLLDLMEKNHVYCLMDITEQQAEAYMEQNGISALVGDKDHVKHQNMTRPLPRSKLW